jgi:HlyD family secretion protein
MDIARPDQKRKKRRRQILTTSLSLLVLAAMTVGVMRLKPAVPTVEHTWPDTVKRGEMLIEVRGNGTLVPEQIQYVQADTDGRVERILVMPGTEVKADTVILELSNPELKQLAFDAEWQLKAADAQATRLKIQLESERLTQQSMTASLKTDLVQAKLEAEADDLLAKDGLVALLTAKRSRARADDLEARYVIETKRLEISAKSAEAQIAVQQAEVEKLRASLALKHRQVAALNVVAGIDGVLQQIGDREMLQTGQRISPSATLAKVVQPSRLKAELKVGEIQAKDIQFGQRAKIDLRSGVFVPGRVTRIDPAVVNGTRTVEIKLEGSLPRGAVPDMNVDGTIELDRLEDALFVGIPVGIPSDTTVGVYKIVENGKEAVRVPVKLGRRSVMNVEVLSGLNVGDQIITSDMAQWSSHERLRLN